MRKSKSNSQSHLETKSIKKLKESSMHTHILKRVLSFSPSNKQSLGFKNYSLSPSNKLLPIFQKKPYQDVYPRSQKKSTGTVPEFEEFFRVNRIIIKEKNSVTHPKTPYFRSRRKSPPKSVKNQIFASNRTNSINLNEISFGKY